MLDRANKQYEALTNDHNCDVKRLQRVTEQKETAKQSLTKAEAEVLQAEALYEEQQSERKLHASTFPTSRMLVSFFLNMSTGAQFGSD